MFTELTRLEAAVLQSYLLDAYKAAYTAEDVIAIDELDDVLKTLHTEAL